MNAPDQKRVGWPMLVEVVTRPYSLSTRTLVLLLLLMLLVPGYIFIGELMMPGRTLHAPELSLDRVLPVKPAWALVYGLFYLYLILLPVVLVRQDEHVRRTVLAYLAVWVLAYACFLLYPTIAPRPGKVLGEGFLVWGLRFLYAADPPYNCFPSLHVAHSFVSALSCYRVHRGVGLVGCVCGVLIGISTLYTKQHYIVDVVAGVGLAYAAYSVFLSRYQRDAIPLLERRVAPHLATMLFLLLMLLVVGLWAVYRITLVLT